MNYQYLIIGGGMTAAAAVDGIREVDATGSIGIVSAEPDAPYNRPPLSKGLWKGEPLDGIWRKTKGKAPELHLGRVIKEIVPREKRVIDSNGNALPMKNFSWRPEAGLVICRSLTIGLSIIAPSPIIGAFAS